MLHVQAFTHTAKHGPKSNLISHESWQENMHRATRVWIQLWYVVAAGRHVPALPSSDSPPAACQ